MPKQPFVIQERVRWGDIDLAGIIRYDAYVRFFELAEGEVFRAAGLAIGNLAERLGVWLPRKVLHVDFHSPAVLDEQLSVVAYFTRIGTTSLTINFDVMDERCESLRASGYEVIVCVGDRAMAPKPLPDAIKAGFAPYLMDSEEARQGAKQVRGA